MLDKQGYMHASTCTHKYVILITFPWQKLFANAPQCYVIRTLSVLFFLRLFCYHCACCNWHQKLNLSSLSFFFRNKADSHTHVEALLSPLSSIISTKWRYYFSNVRRIYPNTLWNLPSLFVVTIIYTGHTAPQAVKQGFFISFIPSFSVTIFTPIYSLS
jgi:hypothetical protein